MSRRGSAFIARVALYLHVALLVQTAAPHAMLWVDSPMRSGLALLAVSFRPVSACALGFAFLGIPVCLTPVFSPRVGTLRGFSGSAAHDPVREGAPQIHDDGLLLSAATRAGAVFTQACHLQERCSLVDAFFAAMGVI